MLLLPLPPHPLSVQRSGKAELCSIYIHEGWLEIPVTTQSTKVATLAYELEFVLARARGPL